MYIGKGVGSQPTTTRSADDYRKLTGFDAAFWGSGYSLGLVHTSIKCFTLFDYHSSVVSPYPSE
jgi:hypothetical protein